MNFARLALFAACFAITSFWMSSAALLAEEPQELEARYRAILKSHRESMAKLKTGVAIATGRLNDVAGGGIQGDVKLFMAFDKDKDLFRFDRTEPLATAVAVDGGERIAGGRFVRTSQIFISKAAKQNTANVELAKNDIPDWIRPIDLQVLGLAHYGDIARGTHPSEVESSYDKQIPIAIEEEGSLVKVTWKVGITARRIVWFNKDKAYWPVYFSLAELSGAKERKGQRQNSLAQEFLIEVAMHDGVYVPTKVILRSDNLDREETLNFTWKSINKEVDGQLFTPEGMSQKDIQYVADSTKGTLEVRELPGFQNAAAKNGM